MQTFAPTIVAVLAAATLCSPGCGADHPEERVYTHLEALVVEIEARASDAGAARAAFEAYLVEHRVAIGLAMRKLAEGLRGPSAEETRARMIPFLGRIVALQQRVGKILAVSPDLFAYAAAAAD